VVRDVDDTGQFRNGFDELGLDALDKRQTTSSRNPGSRPESFKYADLLLFVERDQVGADHRVRRSPD